MCHAYPVAKLSADLLIKLIGTFHIRGEWRQAGKPVAVDRMIRYGTNSGQDGSKTVIAVGYEATADLSAPLSMVVDGTIQLLPDSTARIEDAVPRSVCCPPNLEPNLSMLSPEPPPNAGCDRPARRGRLNRERQKCLSSRPAVSSIPIRRPRSMHC